jgi:glycosyltransferase involved in cell wall biosynthesis
MAASSLKIPVILHTFHGHVFDAYFSHLSANFYKNIERRLAKKSTGIIAISQAQKHDLSHKFKICPEEKIRIIPLGFDLSRFREDQEEKREAFRQKYLVEKHEIAIGIIGRLVPIKNHGLFLDALQILNSKSNQKIRAFIIGDGESRAHIEQKARLNGIDYTHWQTNPRKASITFTGWITEMDQVNAGLDIIALCSLNEGTPVSLIEAQAAGKPIVSTNVGGIANVVIPGKTAVLTNSLEAQEFAENLLFLTENEFNRKEMGKESWKNVMDKFHYQRLVDDMAAYYYELLADKGIK